MAKRPVKRQFGSMGDELPDLTLPPARRGKKPVPPAVPAPAPAVAPAPAPARQLTEADLAGLTPEMRRLAQEDPAAFKGRNVEPRAPRAAAPAPAQVKAWMADEAAVAGAQAQFDRAATDYRKEFGPVAQRPGREAVPPAPPTPAAVPPGAQASVPPRSLLSPEEQAAVIAKTQREYERSLHITEGATQRVERGEDIYPQGVPAKGLTAERGGYKPEGRTRVEGTIGGRRPTPVAQRPGVQPEEPAPLHVVGRGREIRVASPGELTPEAEQALLKQRMTEASAALDEIAPPLGKGPSQAFREKQRQLTESVPGFEPGIRFRPEQPSVAPTGAVAAPAMPALGNQFDANAPGQMRLETFDEWTARAARDATMATQPAAPAVAPTQRARVPAAEAARIRQRPPRGETRPGIGGMVESVTVTPAGGQYIPGHPVYGRQAAGQGGAGAPQFAPVGALRGYSQAARESMRSERAQALKRLDLLAKEQAGAKKDYGEHQALGVLVKAWNPDEFTNQADRTKAKKFQSLLADFENNGRNSVMLSNFGQDIRDLDKRFPVQTRQQQMDKAAAQKEQAAAQKQQGIERQKLSDNRLADAYKQRDYYFDMWKALPNDDENKGFWLSRVGDANETVRTILNERYAPPAGDTSRPTGAAPVAPTGSQPAATAPSAGVTPTKRMSPAAAKFMQVAQTGEWQPMRNEWDRAMAAWDKGEISPDEMTDMLREFNVRRVGVDAVDFSWPEWVKTNEEGIEERRASLAKQSGAAVAAPQGVRTQAEEEELRKLKAELGQTQ